jgi:hypothetical protein
METPHRRSQLTDVGAFGLRVAEGALLFGAAAWLAQSVRMLRNAPVPGAVLEGVADFLLFADVICFGAFFAVQTFRLRRRLQTQSDTHLSEAQTEPFTFGDATRELAAFVASALRSALSFAPEPRPMRYFFSDDTEASRHDWEMVGVDVSREFSHLSSHLSSLIAVRGPDWARMWLDSQARYYE